MKRTLLGSVAVTLALGALAPLPAALGAPSGTKISRVFQGPCRQSVCKVGEDRLLSSGSLVRETIQIHVASSSTFGLEWVRLDVRAAGSDDWSCMRMWDTSADNFGSSYNWDTNRWPTSCGGNERLTENGEYFLRAVARERVTGDVQTSAAFLVRVSNRPSAPEWADDPSVSGADRRATVVTLKWRANPEPDMVEYHIVRTDPSGGEIEMAVNANRPQDQGCRLDGSVYSCRDDAFSRYGYGGRYEYLLVAYRASPSTSDRCALSGGGCIQSPMQEQGRTVEVEEPPPPSPTPSASDGPSSSPTASAGGSRSSGSASPTAGAVAGRSYSRRPSSSSSDSSREFYTGTYDPTLPYQQERVLVPGTGGKRTIIAAGDPLPQDTGLADEDRTRRLYTSIAAGLILLLVAVHLARALRRSERS